MESEMDKIASIFYEDGQRLALEHLNKDCTKDSLYKAMQVQYENIDQLIESFVVRCKQSNVNVDCKKGCEYCCHQLVYASIHEVLYITHYLKEHFSKEEIEGIGKKASAKADESVLNKENGISKLSHPCPLLVDGSCSVYSVRPMACRIYLSSDVNSCKLRYNLQDDEKNYPALFEFLLVAGRNMNSGFGSKLSELEYQVVESSLESLLAKVINEYDFEETWWDKLHMGI